MDAKITALKDFENGTYTIKITEELTSTSSIKTALTTLQDNNPNVFVDLDLSGTTSLTSIGDSAFRECTNLASVTVKAATPPTLGSSAFYNNKSGRKIYVLKGTADEYKAADNWSSYKSYIEAIPE